MITLLSIGAVAVGSDGYRGEVRAAVIDPVAATVTHLVVEPEGRSGLARLVPLKLAEAEADSDDYDVRAAPGKLRLRCTEAEFMNLDAAEETLAEFAVGQTVPVQLLPPAGAGPASRSPRAATSPGSRSGRPSTSPRRARSRSTAAITCTPPTATSAGCAASASTRPAAGSPTCCSAEGHLWGRKEVAIPFDQIAGFDQGIRLSLTKKQVQDLPPAGS